MKWQGHGPDGIGVCLRSTPRITNIASSSDSEVESAVNHDSYFVPKGARSIRRMTLLDQSIGVAMWTKTVCYPIQPDLQNKDDCGTVHSYLKSESHIRH